MQHPLLDLSVTPVVGHRGNAAHAPENTIESFQQAVAIGVDALELDVHLSSDGHVVVIHDSTIDRTTDHSGRVERLTLAEIRQADAGARYTADQGSTHPYRDQGIHVPTLDEVLDTFGEMPLLIEIKTPAAALATRQAIERHRAGTRCVVAAFNEASMEPFHGSSIAQGATRLDTAKLLWRATLRIPARRVDFNVMCMPPVHRGLPLPVGGYARILEPLGVPVHVWTIDDVAQARRLRQRGVRGIISNDPAAIIAGTTEQR
jgi:glycerophosphoryl diester phosphodiesterase